MGPYSKYINAIQAAYPDFVVDTIRPNHDGQYNDVFLVNERLIFRFPRYRPGLEQLALETKILTAVHPYITLNTPVPIFAHFDTDTIGEAFMGYELLPGEPLWLSTFQTVKDEIVVARLAYQLAQFLQELHQVPIRNLIDDELPVSDTKAEWEDVYGRIQTKLFPYMRLDACRDVAAHFETFLSNDIHYQPCLRHGDFGSGNILYDPQKQRISGIIDFGFTVLGDPAFDCAGILNLGESFLRRFVVTYPEVDTYWDRIWFYKGTFALLEALFGIENGDEDAFMAGIEAYV